MEETMNVEEKQTMPLDQILAEAYKVEAQKIINGEIEVDPASKKTRTAEAKEMAEMLLRYKELETTALSADADRTLKQNQLVHDDNAADIQRQHEMELEYLKQDAAEKQRQFEAEQNALQRAHEQELKMRDEKIARGERIVKWVSTGVTLATAALTVIAEVAMFNSKLENDREIAEDTMEFEKEYSVRSRAAKMAFDALERTGLPDLIRRIR